MKVHSQLQGIALGVALAIGAGTAAYAPPANAQWVVYDPANFMQNLQQALQSVEQVSNQIKDYAAQMQQIQNQVAQLANEGRNLASLPTSVLQQYQQIYGQYAQQVQQLQGLMSNLSKTRDQFQQQYPDIAKGNQSFQQLTALTSQWQTSGRQNIEDALAGGASVLGTLPTSQQGFQTLGQASQSATGALQAMQAGNQINMMVGQELMKLNAQTAMFEQAVLQEQARQQGADQVSQRYLDNAYNGGNAYKPSTATPAPALGSH